MNTYISKIIGRQGTGNPSKGVRLLWPMLQLLLLGILLTLFAPGTARAEGPTEVGGTITSNTVWQAVYSPYIISGSNLLVQSGATLTIEPGVTVQFGSGRVMQIEGCLVAQGTEENPITFTSNQETPTAGYWKYIMFTDSSTDASYDGSGNYAGGSIMQNCVVEYAGQDSSYPAAIFIDHASPCIDQSTVRYSSRRGIFASYSSSHISNCTINSNSGGVYLNNPSNMVVEGNTIEGNSTDIGSGIYCYYGTVTISGNTINNNTATYNSSDLGGGGIFGYYANVTISGNTINGNSSAANGGGIRCQYGNYTISGNTISGNTSSYGGGGISFYDTNSGWVNINHNIITNNVSSSGQGGGVCLQYYPNSSTQLHYNDIYNNSGYDVYNSRGSGLDLSATNNWWGTTDSNAIASHIYDWYDNNSKAKVTYTPFLYAASPGAAPVVSFTYTVDGSTLTFINNSSDEDGNIVSYSWDFGDGTTSSQQAPVHTFPEEAVYEVVLTVTDGGGLSASQTESVTIGQPGPSIPVTGVSLDQSTLSLIAGGPTVTLVATVTPVYATNKNIIWSSSDESVATVNNGVITALDQGQATITATSQDNSELSASCQVTVTLQSGNLQGTIQVEEYSGPEGIAIFLYDAQNSLVDQTSTDAQGVYSFEVGPGTYLVKTEKLDYHLSGGAVDVVVTSGQATIVPEIKILYGDLNNDNVIDMLDLIKITQNFGEEGK